MTISCKSFYFQNKAETNEIVSKAKNYFQNRNKSNCFHNKNLFMKQKQNKLFPKQHLQNFLLKCEQNFLHWQQEIFRSTVHLKGEKFFIGTKLPSTALWLWACISTFTNCYHLNFILKIFCSEIKHFVSKTKLKQNKMFPNQNFVSKTKSKQSNLFPKQSKLILKQNFVFKTKLNE